MTKPQKPQQSSSPRSQGSPKKSLSDAAARALAEVEERKKARNLEEATRPEEVGGREGPEPTRYGDWEKGGLAKDF